MGYYPEFAKLLDDRLYEQHRSQSWLAQRLGVSPGTVNRWCKGEFRPNDPETVVRIANSLGVHDPAKREALLIAAGYGYQETPEREDLESVKRSKPDKIAPFMTPPLPTQGVWGRDDTLDEVGNMLAMTKPRTTHISPVALRGLGGIGKTTLAIALGRSKRISTLFPDGVLWVALGPEPTVRLLLNGWGRALGVDLLPERGESACSERLRAILHHRRMLLLIDDVWQVGHGKYFTVAGPHCRTLITTREPEIAYTLATKKRTLRVDVLKPKPSLELLDSLAPEAVSSDADMAKRLCQRLEFLPLALTLAGRMLAVEADVPSRMKRITEELLERREARLQLLQTEGRLGLNEDEPVSLQAILGLSVERLNKNDQERFAIASVFGGDPLTWEINAAAFVWECSVEQAEDTVSRFIRRGLIERRGERYWMHALLADYAAEMMAALE